MTSKKDLTLNPYTDRQMKRGMDNLIDCYKTFLIKFGLVPSPPIRK